MGWHQVASGSFLDTEAAKSSIAHWTCGKVSCKGFGVRQRVLFRGSYSLIYSIVCLSIYLYIYNMYIHTHTVLYYAMLYYSLLTVLYFIIYDIVLYYTVLYKTMLHKRPGPQLESLSLI